MIDDRITLWNSSARRVPRRRAGRPELSLRPAGRADVRAVGRRAVRDWLAKEPTIPLRTDSDRLERVIAECRATGYLVERLTPGGRRLYALMAGMSSSLPDELRALLGELVSDIGERVYLRSEIAGDGATPRHQRHLRTGVRPPPAPGHGGLTADRPRPDRPEITKRARGLVATADADQPAGRPKPALDRLESASTARASVGDTCSPHRSCTRSGAPGWPALVGLLRMVLEVPVELPDRDECRLPGEVDQGRIHVRVRGEVPDSHLVTELMVSARPAAVQSSAAGRRGGVACHLGLRSPPEWRGWHRLHLLQVLRIRSAGHASPLGS